MLGLLPGNLPVYCLPSLLIKLHFPPFFFEKTDGGGGREVDRNCESDFHVRSDELFRPAMTCAGEGALLVRNQSR